MIRRLLTASLLLSLAAAAAAQDTVFVTESAGKKMADVTPVKDGMGKVIGYSILGPIEEEGPTGVKLKFKKGKDMVVDVTVPAGDITKIHYFVGKENAREFRSPVDRVEMAAKLNEAKDAKFRKVQLEKALDDFKKLDTLVRGNDKARRYVDYKVIETKLLLAEDDETKRDEAVKLLTAFKDENPTAWTIVPALKTLARLHEEARKPDEAAKAYEALAKVPGVPKELKQESDILVSRMLLRNGKHAEAQARLQALAETMSGGDVMKPFVTAHLAEAKINQGKTDGVSKELEEAIKGNVDGRLRGLCYGLLGDMHLKAGRQEDAFWAYLRVEAMYNDDADHQAKALYFLGGDGGAEVGLFDKVKKDPARARDCVRRLRDGRFAGTTYQKLLKAEKKEEADDFDEEPKGKDAKKEEPKKDKGKQ